MKTIERETCRATEENYAQTHVVLSFVVNHVGVVDHEALAWAAMALAGDVLERSNLIEGILENECWGVAPDWSKEGGVPGTRTVTVVEGRVEEKA